MGMGTGVSWIFCDLDGHAREVEWLCWCGGSFPVNEEEVDVGGGGGTMGRTCSLSLLDAIHILFVFLAYWSGVSRAYGKEGSDSRGGKGGGYHDCAFTQRGYFRLA